MRFSFSGMIILALVSATSGGLADESLRNRGIVNSPEPENSVHLAQADTQKEGGQANDERAEGQMSEKCVKLARDPDADVGVVIRAGCEPTIA